MAGAEVAEVEGQLAGFFILRDAELYQFYVASTARGQGVAQTLMQRAETRIADEGHSTAWLDCSVGNDRAARFYEKCGWVNLGPRETSFDTGAGPFQITAWRFEKALR